MTAKFSILDLVRIGVYLTSSQHTFRLKLHAIDENHALKFPFFFFN